MTTIEIRNNEQFAFLSADYDQIFLNEYIDGLSDRQACLALRRSIGMAPEVVVTTAWNRDKIMAAILACSNPIKSITWGREGYLNKVVIRRNFP